MLHTSKEDLSEPVYEIAGILIQVCVSAYPYLVLNFAILENELCQEKLGEDVRVHNGILSVFLSLLLDIPCHQ